jgi:aspartyl-tRNA(Asn)/glutamyl-tRNA(Gln) amidotransferase subunit B
MHSAEEAKTYAQELYLLMKYAEVSDVDLYHGNMRFDVNVSVSKDPTEFGTRTETKNLNSFRSVHSAIEYEIKRQIEELEAGRSIKQETRGWNDAKQKTFSQRSKEDAHDYRYFPDPDIPPVVLDQPFIESVEKSMNLMPQHIRSKMAKAGIGAMVAETLLESMPLTKRWLEIAKKTNDTTTQKRIADWFAGEVVAQLSNKPDLKIEKLLEENTNALGIDGLIKLSEMVSGDAISSTSAKRILSDHWMDLYDPEKIAKELDLLQVSDESELEQMVGQILSTNEKAVADVVSGEMKAIGFLVGQVMKASKGKAHPAKVQKAIRKQLGV